MKKHKYSIDPFVDPETPEDLEKKAIDFEQKHGTLMFLKASISSLHRLLSSKGTISANEIGLSMLKEMELFSEAIEKDKDKISEEV